MSAAVSRIEIMGMAHDQWKRVAERLSKRRMSIMTTIMMMVW